MDSVAFASGCWGNYWERFGSEYIRGIEAMNPRPAEIVVVTDAAITTIPNWLRVVRPRSAIPMWDWFNEAVEACASTWVICAGIDDVPLPDGLADLRLAGDVVAIAGLENGRPWCPSEDGWRHIIGLQYNPMAGGAIFRREVFLRFPWRRMIGSDWAQWLELRHAGAIVTFDHKPRYNHIRWDGAHSIGPIPGDREQIFALKTMLGLIAPGPEWPPIPLQFPIATTDAK